MSDLTLTAVDVAELRNRLVIISGQAELIRGRAEAGTIIAFKTRIITRAVEEIVELMVRSGSTPLHFDIAATASSRASDGSESDPRCSTLLSEK